MHLTQTCQSVTTDEFHKNEKSEKLNKMKLINLANLGLDKPY